MKQYLLILLILLVAGAAMAQKHVSDLVVSPLYSGGTIKWYDAATGGNVIDGTAVLTSRTYWASQTVNGVESTARLAVTATVTVTPVAPAAGTNTPSQTGVVWNWNTAMGATGYKWGITNVYADASDISTATTKTETGLSCGTSYTRYIWAYNTAACPSAATSLTQTTSTCLAEIAGGASSVCIGSTTPAFTNAASGGTWSISSGGSRASIDSNGIVTGLDPGSATVAYTLSGNTVTTTITVNALPTPTFTVQTLGTTMTYFQVIYTTQNGKSNYVWTYPGTLNIDYTITVGGGNTNWVCLFYNTSGDKTVTVNYSENGCTAATATSSNPITVYAQDNNQ